MWIYLSTIESVLTGRARNRRSLSSWHGRNGYTGDTSLRTCSWIGWTCKDSQGYDYDISVNSCCPGDLLTFNVPSMTYVECPNQWDSHTQNNKCTCSNGFHGDYYQSDSQTDSSVHARILWLGGTHEHSDVRIYLYLRSLPSSTHTIAVTSMRNARPWRLRALCCF